MDRRFTQKVDTLSSSTRLNSADAYSLKKKEKKNGDILLFLNHKPPFRVAGRAYLFEPLRWVDNKAV